MIPPRPLSPLAADTLWEHCPECHFQIGYLLICMKGFTSFSSAPTQSKTLQQAALLSIPRTRWTEGMS